MHVYTAPSSRACSTCNSTYVGYIYTRMCEREAHLPARRLCFPRRGRPRNLLLSAKEREGEWCTLCLRGEKER